MTPIDTQDRLDLEDLGRRMVRLRELDAKVQQAEERYRRCSGEARQARKAVTLARAELRTALSAATRPMPLFEHARTHTVEEVAAPITEPAANGHVDESDDARERWEAAMAQPSMQPARDAANRSASVAVPVPPVQVPADQVDAPDDAHERWKAEMAQPESRQRVGRLETAAIGVEHLKLSAELTAALHELGLSTIGDIDAIDSGSTSLSTILLRHGVPTRVQASEIAAAHTRWYAERACAAREAAPDMPPIPPLSDEDVQAMRKRQDAAKKGAATTAARLKGAPVWYGWTVTYSRNDSYETETCHYVGSEATARRKTMLRRNAKEILSCEGLTEEQYVRMYGRGKM